MNIHTPKPAEPNLPEPELKFHPLANLFPPMEGEEFKAFVEDLKNNGQREPVIVHQGMVLDGCNRVRACQELKVAVKQKPFEGGDPISFVLSVNLHRRHLNETQRGIVAAKVANMRRGGKEANPSKDGIDKTSQEQAAKLLNVSVKTVERASKLISSGTPELVRAAEQGKVKVSAAKKLLEKSKEEQQKLINEKKGDVVQAIQSLKSPDTRNAETVLNDAYANLEEKLINKLQEFPSNKAKEQADVTIGKLKATVKTMLAALENQMKAAA